MSSGKERAESRVAYRDGVCNFGGFRAKYLWEVTDMQWLVLINFIHVHVQLVN